MYYIPYTRLYYPFISYPMLCHAILIRDQTRPDGPLKNHIQRPMAHKKQAAKSDKQQPQATANLFATEKMQAKPAAGSNNNTKARQHKQPEVGADSDDHKIRRATKRRTNSRRTTTSISCSSTKQNMWNCGSAC